MTARENAARREIRRQLTLMGCPADLHSAMPSWEVGSDRTRSKWHVEYTGVIRVKVYFRRKTKQFLSNDEGKFKDISKVSKFIHSAYSAHVQEREASEREERREKELEPIAERLREEFDAGQYGGDVRIEATGQGLMIFIRTIADEDQIRAILTRAKELGMREPAKDEPVSTTPTIFDRINEDGHITDFRESLP